MANLPLVQKRRHSCCPDLGTGNLTGSGENGTYPQLNTQVTAASDLGGLRCGDYVSLCLQTS